MQTAIKLMLMVSLIAWGLVFSPGICVSGNHEHECDEHDEHESQPQESDCGFYCCDQTFIPPATGVELLFTGDSFIIESPDWLSAEKQPVLLLHLKPHPLGGPRSLPLRN